MKARGGSPVGSFVARLSDAVLTSPLGATLLSPSRVRQPRRYLRGLATPRILDLGCGNHSPTFFRFGIPDCSYTGVDSSVYNNTSADLGRADRLLFLDLEQTHLEDLPNGTFDLVVTSHILEHLKRGVAMLDYAIPKLRQGGILFVAYPSPASVSFPHMKGTLNFYDDPTHVTLIGRDDLTRVVHKHGMQILDTGTSRSSIGLVIMLFRIVTSPLFGGITGPMFWDLYGFEDYLVAIKR